MTIAIIALLAFIGWALYQQGLHVGYMHGNTDALGDLYYRRRNMD